MILELQNWVKDGQYRMAILAKLQKKNYLSSELASELKVNRASMSRILKNLKDKELVSCVKGNSRTVTYLITELGKKVLELVQHG